MTFIRGERGLRWAILAIAGVLYLPLIFRGPGSDADSIGVIESGCRLLLQHHYEPSRYPGYFPYEALTGILFNIGGSTLTNFASLLVSLLALDSFLDICATSDVPARHLLAVLLAIQPLYWANSTSSIDFVWGLSAFLTGYRLMLRKRWLLAGLLFGLAIGIRLASSLLVGTALLAYLLERPGDPELWLIALVTAAVGAALYIPEFIAANYSLAFLTYYPRAFGFWGYVGRFVYKNIYLWGVPASGLLVFVTPLVFRNLRRNVTSEQRPLVRTCIFAVVALELMFLKLPHQTAYLLPVVPLVLILLGIALQQRRTLLVALGICILSFDFVSINFAHPDRPRFATHAQLGVWLEKGSLLHDLDERAQINAALKGGSDCKDFLDAANNPNERSGTQHSAF
jgi:hypothetical protein